MNSSTAKNVLLKALFRQGTVQADLDRYVHIRLQN